VRTHSAQGFAIIDLLFVCAIIGVISGIALPKLVQARGSAFSASAIGSLRVINSAQLAFAITCGNGFYAPDLMSLAKLPAGSIEGYIKSDLGAANTVVRSGYTVQMSGTPFAAAPDTCNALGPGMTSLAFKAGADPVDVAGTRFFAINANGSIFEDTATLFATIPEDAAPATGHPL
jgi:Tfp pilus assembly protein PilE